MKNCIICGAVINDTDMVCPVCGGENPPVQVQPYNYNPYLQGQPPQEWFQEEPPQPKKVNGKRIAIIAGAITLAVAIFLVVFFVFVKKNIKRNDPKKIVENYIEAISNNNRARARGYLYDGILNDEDTFDKYYEKAVENFKDLKSRKVVADEKLDPEEAQSYIDRFKDKYRTDVSEVRSVELEVVLAKDSVTFSDKLIFILGKIGSEWYIIDDQVLINESGIGAAGVAERCMIAYVRGDAKTVLECFPDAMYTDSERIQIEQTVNSIKSLNADLNITGIESEKRLSDDEAESYINEAKRNYGIDVSEVTEVSVGYKLDYMGVNDEGTLELICGKIDNRWYVIDGLY
ncbi:MAG: hypothetical protein IJJ74_09245 [Eubacterium sp.]|nr:hypothetical protein [Eubacterium sp.]